MFNKATIRVYHIFLFVLVICTSLALGICPVGDLTNNGTVDLAHWRISADVDEWRCTEGCFGIGDVGPETVFLTQNRMKVLGLEPRTNGLKGRW